VFSSKALHGSQVQRPESRKKRSSGCRFKVSAAGNGDVSFENPRKRYSPPEIAARVLMKLNGLPRSISVRP